MPRLSTIPSRIPLRTLRGRIQECKSLAAQGFAYDYLEARVKLHNDLDAWLSEARGNAMEEHVAINANDLAHRAFEGDSG